MDLLSSCVPVHDTTPSQDMDKVSFGFEACFHDDLFPFSGSKSISSSDIADSSRQLAVPQFQRDQLWFAGEQVVATSYNFYCTESFMEYFLESPVLREGPFGTFEGTLIRGSPSIQLLVGKIVDTLTTMFPHRDFVVGFAERVSQDPT